MTATNGQTAVLPTQFETLFQLLDCAGDGLLCLDADLNVLKMNQIATQWFRESGQLADLEERGLSAFLSSVAVERLMQVLKTDSLSDSGSTIDELSPLVHLSLPTLKTTVEVESFGATDSKPGSAADNDPDAVAPKTLEMRLQRLALADSTDNGGDAQNYLLLGIARDVSGRVSIERALDAARRSAEEASAAKTDILYSVSHDIRTPLNGALGFLELLRKTELDEQQHDFINTVERSTRSMMSIIDQLLDVARIEAGYLDFNATATDVDELLKNCIQLHQTQADAKNLSLSYRGNSNDSSTLVQVDSARLVQVVNNLITNAIKFTVDGDIDVRLKTESIEAHSLHVEITVSDTGIGIYADEMERLFDAYERSQRALTRRAGGVGLGLAISRRLVKGLGGTIGVESTPNVGSTFTVTLDLPLPLKTTTPSPEAKIDDYFRGPISNKRPRVLAVDDSDINLSYLVAMLSHHGIEVTSALGGQQAIDAVRDDPHDLIVLDIHMPTINGFDVLHKIDEFYGRARPPVVALTADASSELKNDIDHAGFDGKLFKPVSEQDFLDLLRRFTGLEISAVRGESTTKPTTSMIDRAFGVNMAGDNEQLWQQNLALFATQIKEMIGSLQAYANGSDREFVAQVSHRIAGTASYLGVAALTRQARKVNDCARDPQQPDLEPQVRRLVEVSQKFLSLADDILSSSEQLASTNE